MLRIGPICRYAEDLPIILKVIVSDDKLESLQLNKSTDLKTLRVFYMNGISNCFVEPLGSECSNALKLAVEHFERKYDICAIRVDLPLVHNALDFYFTSMNVPGEPAMTDMDCAMEFIKLLFGKSEHMFATISQALIENHPMYSEDRKRMIMADRDRLRREVCDLLQDDGILLFPSFPTLAPFHNQPLLTPFNFLYTAIWNTLTLPVLQCPLGLSTDDPSNRLPTGVQVVGSPLSDHLLMAVAQDLEEAFGGWAVPQSVVVNE
ncbi:unnamed protein product [Anisakis simplex]|uniref:Fatty-acid amide hydrolase 2 (inferred by orthology to a human protein) n=1 Tax=Anisakis simplex TaxID=6269 RepID=A0A0M3J1G5_ANISI|nr:unnamed protein product [Anisakis simplex]